MLIARVGGCQQEASGAWREGRHARQKPTQKLPGKAEGRDRRDERQTGDKRAVSQACLREHQRGAGPLQDTRQDEQKRGWRQAA